MSDAFDSKRHSLDAATWGQLRDNMRYMLGSGAKHGLENLAFLPQAVRRVDKGSGAQIELANFEYRIFCHTLRSDVPLHRFRPARDLAPRLSRRPSTAAALRHDRSARFEVNPRVDSQGE